MSLVTVRKKVLHLETIFHEGGPAPERPLRIAVAAAVVKNPYAGHYEENLMPFMEALAPLGEELARDAFEALDGDKSKIEVFGKASLVGDGGEIEHAATWHAPGGAGLRKLLDARGFVASSKGMGGIGTRLMIPLLYIHSVWARSHFGVADVSIHDAPRSGELVFASALGTGGRIHARVGGKTPAEADAGERP